MRDYSRGGSQRISFLAVALLVAVYPTNAFAYIDPGSGSLLVQIVMSAFFGVVFLARNFLSKTVILARRIFSKEKVEKTTPPDEPVT